METKRTRWRLVPLERRERRALGDEGRGGEEPDFILSPVESPVQCSYMSASSLREHKDAIL